jgi:murein DD-endopeptidase MepM/ murein hydrolase activator NlpD
LFLRGAWLIIAGVLLLGPPAVLAESYIKVWEKGVVYYYVSSRKHPQPSQAGMNPPALRRVASNPQTRGALPAAQAFFPEMGQPQNLWPSLIKAVIRLDSKRQVKAAFPIDAPGLTQLRLGKANDSPVVNASDPKDNIWTGPRYLGRLLAKTGYRSPLASGAPNPGSRQLDRHQDLPPIQEIQALVRDVCKNFLKYAQEVKPGADRFAELNQLSYCFPVAPPYSFRDTWGDYRSGGRYHHAVDIFAGEGTPIYAITSGVIHQLASWPEAGISLLMRGQDGKGYGYMHLQGYAPGVLEGKNVKKGELIAYVGHTGTKQSSPHLHLQIYTDHSFDRAELVNPYGLLVQLCNGNGVTDFLYPKIARLRIPAAEIITHGTLRFSNSTPRRYQTSQRRAEDASTLLTNTY